MIDSLVHFREKAAQTTIMDELGLEPSSFVLMTMHRPSNVDHEAGLRQLLATMRGITDERPLVFPMHPRTRNRFSEFGLDSELRNVEDLILLEPLGYLEFLRLMEQAAVVVTDSGGIQEETTFLQVPCLTLRDNTERPITVEMGTNELLPMEPERIIRRVSEVAGAVRSDQRPPLWDGQTAERIVGLLHDISSKAR
jgi:UDP-N-acetylglucosamine 2-epimerase (non-hydrolysing)